jgi:hypothetical protein
MLSVMMVVSAFASPLTIQRNVGKAVADAPLFGAPTLGTLRNNYTGEVGTQLVIGSSPIIVTALGRWVVAGNSGSHVVYLINDRNTVIASATVNTSGASAGICKYTALATPVTLSAGVTYYLLSAETSAGDQWYDEDTRTTLSPAVTVAKSGFIPGTDPTANVQTGAVATGATFGPVNLLYHTTTYFPNASALYNGAYYGKTFPGVDGVVDGKTGIISIWIKTPTTGAFNNIWLDGTAAMGMSIWPTGDVLKMVMVDTGATVRVHLRSTVTVADGTWHHCLIAWDAANSANCKVYIDDVDRTDVQLCTNFTLDYTFNEMDLGYNNAGWSISEFYVSYNHWLDLSVAANRRLFITAALKPAGDLTLNGAPVADIYFKNPSSTLGTNSGTGGNFSLNGSPSPITVQGPK